MRTDKYTIVWKLAVIMILVSSCSSTYHLRKAIKKGWKPTTEQVEVRVNDSVTVTIPCPEIDLPKTRQEIRQENKTDRTAIKQNEKSNRTYHKEATKQIKSANKAATKKEKAAVKNNRIDSRENAKIEGCSFWSKFWLCIVSAIVGSIATILIRILKQKR